MRKSLCSQRMSLIVRKARGLSWCHINDTIKNLHKQEGILRVRSVEIHIETSVWRSTLTVATTVKSDDFQFLRSFPRFKLF